MRINQEVDALQVIGMDPMRFLVLPRCLALLITLPILSLYAVVMAYVGGGLVVVLALEIPTIQFFRQLADAISVQAFVAGMIKAPVFAFVIAAVGCYKGLQVSGSAASVGRLTTQSVVISIFLVIVLDAFFSILFAVMGI